MRAPDASRTRRTCAAAIHTLSQSKGLIESFPLGPPTHTFHWSGLSPLRAFSSRACDHVPGPNDLMCIVKDLAGAPSASMGGEEMVIGW
jgi:hypothetical protein